MMKTTTDDLQRSIETLNLGCRAEGFKVDELLERPLEEIVPFARRWKIPLEDLRDICHLLIQRLGELHADSGGFEELVPSPSALHSLPPHTLN